MARTRDQPAAGSRDGSRIQPGLRAPPPAQSSVCRDSDRRAVIPRMCGAARRPTEWVSACRAESARSGLARPGPVLPGPGGARTPGIIAGVRPGQGSRDRPSPSLSPGERRPGPVILAVRASAQSETPALGPCVLCVGQCGCLNWNRTLHAVTSPGLWDGRATHRISTDSESRSAAASASHRPVRDAWAVHRQGRQGPAPQVPCSLLYWARYAFRYNYLCSFELMKPLFNLAMPNEHL